MRCARRDRCSSSIEPSCPGGKLRVMDETRVVVVDDSDDVAEVLGAILAANGYVVRTATEGTAALELIEHFKPHCVLLDVNMPHLSGLELSKRLRDRYEGEMVLIATTGASADDARVSEPFDLVDHYLVKPVDIAQLEKILPPLDE